MSARDPTSVGNTFDSNWPYGGMRTYVTSLPWRSQTKPRTASVFMTNRSQAVLLPKEHQFSTDQVFIRKEGRT